MGGDRTYDYLLKAMDRHLKHAGQHVHQKAFENQIQQQIDAMGAGKKPTMAAINQYLAAPGKGTAKGGGKGSGKGGGKGGKGGGKGGSPSPAPTSFCWYHSAEKYLPGEGHKCPYPNDPVTGKQNCRFKHSFMRKEDFMAANRPRAASPGGIAAPAWGGGGGGKGKGKKGKGKSKGKGKDKSPERRMDRAWCEDYLRGRGHEIER